MYYIFRRWLYGAVEHLIMDTMTEKNFLKEVDFSQSELETLILYAEKLKNNVSSEEQLEMLKGKHFALLFEKQSTRTRSAFTVAATKLGASTEYLSKNDIQLGSKESVEDTAKVLGSMFDGIAFRGFKQETVDTLGQHSKVPVWNALTDQWHPTQMLADFLTIKEALGSYSGKTLTYIGDGNNNMANSLLVTSIILGVDINIVAPKPLQPSKKVMNIASELLKTSDSNVNITSSIEKGIPGSDVIYTDVWCSMGEEAEFDQKYQLLKDYQVNQSLISLANNPNIIFLHCLPAIHDTKTEVGQMAYQKFGTVGLEVTDEVFQAPYSKVFMQAENRMHSIKALLASSFK